MLDPRKCALRKSFKRVITCSTMRWLTNSCRVAHPAALPTQKTKALSNQFDALVIGAGAGGISTAALLASKGYRTLIVETKDRIGGRASTRPVDGFLVNTGALVVEYDGAVAEIYRSLGLQLQLHNPGHGATVLRYGGHEFDLARGLSGFLRETGPRLVASLIWLLPWLGPKKGQSTRSWIDRFTSNRTVHSLIDNTLGAMFAARGDLVLAEVFLHYFAKDTSFRKIGLPPGGTIEIWKPLANYVEDFSGQIWLNSTVSNLIVGSNGLVTGAVIRKASGDEIKIHSKVTISNTGPLVTTRLAGVNRSPDSATESIKPCYGPAAIITIHFASQKPLATFPCLAIFGKSRRMVYAGNFSAPELHRCPRGWHLYCGASVPIPATGYFDLESEKELLLQDLRDNFPNFNEAKILAIDVTANEWPAQHAISGFDKPQTTPIANLFSVGDGNKPWASAGTSACSRSGQIVADMITKRFPLKQGP